MKSTVVSSQWLNTHFQDEDIVILDASEKENKSDLKTEYPDLQIVGARYFDTKNTFRDKSNPIPNMLPKPPDFESECRKLGIKTDSRIVIYDNLGVYNSPRVWWMFKVMGHKSVAVLDGGLPDWVNSGYKTESIKDNSARDGNFVSNFQPHLVKVAAEVLDNVSSKNCTVIDARSSGRFHGTSPEPRADLKGGHIPNSINLPFSEVLRNGKFIAKDDLRTVVSKLNISNKPLIFSCGSGITACIILLAMELVNSNPKSIYDGSWSEWGQLDGVPISQ